LSLFAAIALAGIATRGFVCLIIAATSTRKKHMTWPA